MKALILGGCGAQGSFTTRDMVKRNVFDEIVIADLDLRRAEELARELGSPKISTRQVDILDHGALVNSMADVDLVVNCTGPYYLLGPKVVDAAIEAGKNYIDFCDDIVAHKEMFTKDGLAREKGLTMLIGMGCSPGVAPLMVMEAASKMDEVEDVAFPQLINDLEPEGPAVVYHLIENFFGKVPVIKDGQLVEEDAFEGEELVDFGEPLGVAKVSTFGHPELFTLPRALPGIKNLSVKLGVYPVEVYEVLKILAQVGLASPDPLQVKGRDVVPRDFLISLLMAQKHETPPEDYISSMVVEVKGKKDGKPISVKYNANSLMGPVTGIPCSIGAEMIVQGKIQKKGVVFPEECIEPRPFLDEVFRRVRETSVFTCKESVILGDEW